MIRIVIWMFSLWMIFLSTVYETRAQSSVSLPDATAIANYASSETIKLIGYRARITPQVRDDSLHRLAKYIKALNQVDRGKLKSLQKDFQEALLLFTDDEVLFNPGKTKERLERRSIEVVDDALESVFSLDDIKKGYEWNALAYVYGFFNHDVSITDIQNVRRDWESMPEEERAKQYPTYIHLIDAVVKPLAYWHQPSRRDMIAVLEEATPLLNELLFMEPKPGTAFHAPSHAALISVAMYNRWFDEAMYNSRLTRTMGAKTIYGAKLNELLIGNIEDPDSLEKDIYKFYTVREQYVANTLARLNWRYNGKTSAILHKSLDIFNKQGNAERTMHAIERCMVALRDLPTRAKWEDNLVDHVDDYVWIIRNGKQEAVTYATQMLARAMSCPLDKAFELYYKQKISDMQRKMNKKENTEQP